MRDDLLLYYERELSFLRQMGQEFSQKYPKIASRLILEPDKCDDPHVERLLEAFAFLAARVHLRIDDDFPEITEALLSIVYPHYVRPIPSMSIVEFSLDPTQAKLSTGFHVERGRTLYSKPVAGVPCKFQTCYPLTLWPINSVEAEFKTPERLSPPMRAPEAAGVIRWELRANTDISFQKLEMNSLRFHLSGEGNLVNALYELLCCNTLRIVFRDPNPNSKVRPVTLPASALQPVGFGLDEGMVPYPRRAFVGYRLLQEYFAFPEKFFFLDLNGLDEVWSAGFKDRVEILFLLSPFEQQERRQTIEMGLNARTFRLGCVPIVNLFPHTCEPILLDQQKYEYPVVPDVRRPAAFEIFSVDQVVSVSPHSQEVVEYQPFYSFRHTAQRDKRETFWLGMRRPSNRAGDDGTEMHLSLVDLSLRSLNPNADALTVRATCTNRDLPSRLPFGNELGDFEMENSPVVSRIVALRKPTGSVRPTPGKGMFWRLISHLSLNYLSLVEEGREALQEILKLYNYVGSSYSEKQIEGILQLHSKRHFARVISENGITFARGMRIDMEFDEEQFVGGGVYLFASVLERFLGLYTSLNSFSQMIARTRQRKEVMKEWPPRAGQRILL